MGRAGGFSERRSSIGRIAMPRDRARRRSARRRGLSRRVIAFALKSPLTGRVAASPTAARTPMQIATAMYKRGMLITSRRVSAATFAPRKYTAPFIFADARFEESLPLRLSGDPTSERHSTSLVAFDRNHRTIALVSRPLIVRSDGGSRFAILHPPPPSDPATRGATPPRRDT